MDKELQADIDRLKIASFPDDMIAWNASLDRIIARIPEPKSYSVSILKPIAYGGHEPKPTPDFDDKMDTSGDWQEDFPGENSQYECICVKCGKYFVGHKRRVVCKSCSSKTDFDAIAREIETGAFDCFSWNDDVKTFNCEKCAEILRKRFGKEG